MLNNIHKVKGDVQTEMIILTRSPAEGTKLVRNVFYLRPLCVNELVDHHQENILPITGLRPDCHTGRQQTEWTKREFILNEHGVATETHIHLFWLQPNNQKENSWIQLVRYDPEAPDWFEHFRRGACWRFLLRSYSEDFTSQKGIFLVVLYFFSCVGECCSAVVLRSSRNVSWTTRISVSR